MPHTIMLHEATATITNQQETVLASSTKEEKRLLLITKLNMWNGLHGTFRVFQKGFLKKGQPKFAEPYSEVTEEVTPTGPVHYWDFRFLHDAINHYNSIE